MASAANGMCGYYHLPLVHMIFIHVCFYQKKITDFFPLPPSPPTPPFRHIYHQHLQCRTIDNHIRNDLQPNRSLPSGMCTPTSRIGTLSPPHPGRRIRKECLAALLLHRTILQTLSPYSRVHFLLVLVQQSTHNRTQIDAVVQLVRHARAHNRVMKPYHA